MVPPSHLHPLDLRLYHSVHTNESRQFLLTWKEVCKWQSLNQSKPGTGQRSEHPHPPHHQISENQLDVRWLINNSAITDVGWKRPPPTRASHRGVALRPRRWPGEMTENDSLDKTRSPLRLNPLPALHNYLHITQRALAFEEQLNYLLMRRVFGKRGRW